MDNGDKTFVFGCSVFGAVVLSAVVGLTVSTINKDNAVRDMVKAGANPMEAHCSVQGSTPVVTCALLAARGRTE